MHRQLGLILSLLVLVILTYALVGAEQSSNETQRRRCFRFTWLGPAYSNSSEYMNATCADATQLASGVPCFHPLVASYDGSWPDVDYIWRNYPDDATCFLADNDVCATYTYYFDGKPENSTYMCTRAVDTEGHAIRSGCYTQTNGSYTTRACFCQSIAGARPCNNAVSVMVSVVAVTLSVLVMLNRDLLLWNFV